MKKPRCGGDSGTSGCNLTGPVKGMIWLGWLLATCGFGVMLGGVVAMQKACGDIPSDTNITSFGGGSIGYLAPVSCDHLFQYTWWILYLHYFVWFLVLVFLSTNVVHKARGALIGMLAVASVLLMDTANTYLMFNYIPGLAGKMASRTRTTVAGAIISAVADMFLILVIGWDSFSPGRREHTEHYTATTTGGATTTPAAGTVPV